jgi:error-prone DNA polymerase
VTVGDHAMAILRKRLTAPMLATSAQLIRLPSSSAVAMAGLVIARQRPGTAKGTMFLLFEDEFGTVNLIVPRAVYERHRYLARAEPLLLARGRVERTEGVVNLLVRELAALERHISGGLDGAERERIAHVHHLPTPGQADGVEAEEDGAIEVGSSMRAVAPPIQSFAMGRRR